MYFLDLHVFSYILPLTNNLTHFYIHHSCVYKVLEIKHYKKIIITNKVCYVHFKISMFNPMYLFQQALVLVTKINEDKKDVGSLCGGVIISPEYVMTAAHCLANLKSSQKVFQRYIKVKEIILHPKFNLSEGTDDIALVRLKDPIEFNEQVWAACLPWTNFEVPVDSRVTVIGWGQSSGGENSAGKLSDVPKMAAITVKKASHCEGWNVKKLAAGQICAGDATKNACYGDSGGPLVYKMNDELEVVVGIVSFGKSCKSKSNGVVYTKINILIAWNMLTELPNLCKVKSGTLYHDPDPDPGMGWDEAA
ncbi:Plasma kallikrein [Nymphon striatum]|nr:Plasma kallikrein [Nymphon striatum]